jgi:hypothetical protein
MGHVPYALKRPVLTGDFEESLVAVSKELDGQAKFGCVARAILRFAGHVASASQSGAIFLEARLLRFLMGWCTTSNPVLEEQRE